MCTNTGLTFCFPKIQLPKIMKDMSHLLESWESNTRQAPPSPVDIYEMKEIRTNQFSAMAGLCWSIKS